MKNEDRKAAVRAYKERKVEAGIYAIRCGPSGECWVGHAPDLSTIQNRLWFTLRQGGNPHRALQAAWEAHGPDGVTFEVVERFGDDETVHEHDRKDRLARWAETMKAVTI